MNRLYATVVSLLVCGAVLSPLREGFSDAPKDDFPLSWFPMFARPRAAEETPVYVVAVEAAGARHKVPQTFWTSGGFNQGATQLLTARRAGAKALEPLCTRVAEKVGRSRRKEYAETVEVRILRGRYSRETFFRDGDRTPLDEKTLTTCAIPARGKQ
ncbi:MAG: hypothetical protein Q8P41_22745 [Pseudomonadota bacterium]|nr:hypothetical protein [Pseudomonadota bacterium]